MALRFPWKPSAFCGSGDADLNRADVPRSSSTGFSSAHAERGGVVEMRRY
jgi:hypothetical protein